MMGGGGAAVDEAKLKMYARYAGLGALGGVYFFIMDTTIDIFDKGWEEHLFLYYYSLPLAMMIVLAMFGPPFKLLIGDAAIQINR